MVQKEKLPVSIIKMDVDSDDSVTAAVATATAQGGFIQALVNNAGLEANGSIEEMPLKTFRSVMETNYFGPLRCIKACLPEMRKRQSGCIVNLSSVAGRFAASPMGPYTTSKFALEAISEVLAQEVKAFNVRVAIVEPGVIDTPMARRAAQPPADSPYPQHRRFAAMFVASLGNPVPPSLVAETIREIIESETTQLRHPLGPSAAGLLQWRASMSDEDFVSWGALQDSDWYDRVHKEFGLDARPRGEQSWRRPSQ